MIGYLTGSVLQLRERSVIILTSGGVGYEVFASRLLLRKLQLEEKIHLCIHTHQTSDTISLFGFREEKNLKFFELLNSVNGVGPKTALDILENPVEVIENIIVSGDAKKLSETKGIGKKTAARIVLELKAKITGGDPEVPASGEIDPDVMEALLQLGYRKADIEKHLAKLPAEIIKTEAIVKWFLQNA
ncbi:MAG: Holliday junction branch migration protein RuvA [Candidatus Gracilibacteria bacterium]|jgi:Holliday junction DNA helicase RuvA